MSSRLKYLNIKLILMCTEFTKELILCYGSYVSILYLSGFDVNMFIYIRFKCKLRPSNYWVAFTLRLLN